MSDAFLLGANPRMTKSLTSSTLNLIVIATLGGTAEVEGWGGGKSKGRGEEEGCNIFPKKKYHNKHINRPRQHKLRHHRLFKPNSTRASKLAAKEKKRKQEK